MAPATLPSPKPQHRHSSLHQPRSGGREEIVLESEALIYFFFRSWEQRGQNLKEDVTEKRGDSG